MIVMAFRTEGNHRYSRIKNKRSLFVSRTRPCSLRRTTVSDVGEPRSRTRRAEGQSYPEQFCTVMEALSVSSVPSDFLLLQPAEQGPSVTAAQDAGAGETHV